jgi:hypothetical protein
MVLALVLAPASAVVPKQISLHLSLRLKDTWQCNVLLISGMPYLVNAMQYSNNTALRNAFEDQKIKRSPRYLV